MIISHILGGIGNQMFQYAAGRSLAHANQDRLLLDISSFDDYTLHHGFQLSRVFDIDAEQATFAHIKHVLGYRACQYCRKILKRPLFKPLRGRNLIVEPYAHFWPDFFSFKHDAYLLGYWQSEKYFRSIASQIRKDFTFKTALVGKNADIASSIQNQNAISLHVRRGDYLSDLKTSQIMNVCSLDYYQSSINAIADRVASPVFYIFSDDIEWVRRNLVMDYPCVYVDHNTQEDSFRDMQLMSLCKHHIIANSSFSWWGAWLNPCESKIVIAPKGWFVNGSDDGDIIPSDWERL
jgi:hypothetical protein